jgi:hypothetical protein
MKIQGFVFNWKGYQNDARALEEKIGRFINVTVINSEEHLNAKYPEWSHLDDTAYFSAQWNKAVELFNADIFFHIQADAEFDDFEALLAKTERLFEKYGLGACEPNVDYSSVQYEKSSLPSIEPNVLVVPMTDSTCWFIAGEIMRKLPPIDLSINRYGWGIPRAIAALSRLSGMRIVRDYNFTVKHPRSTGYPLGAAMQQLKAYIWSLDPEVRTEIFRCMPAGNVALLSAPSHHSSDGNASPVTGP